MRAERRHRLAMTRWPSRTVVSPVAHHERALRRAAKGGGALSAEAVKPGRGAPDAEDRALSIAASFGVFSALSLQLARPALFTEAQAWAWVTVMITSCLSVSIAAVKYSGRRPSPCLLSLSLGSVFWFAWPAGKLWLTGTWPGERQRFLLQAEDVGQAATAIATYLGAAAVSYLAGTWVSRKWGRRPGLLGGDVRWDRLSLVALGLGGASLLALLAIAGGAANLIRGVLSARGGAVEAPWHHIAFEGNVIAVLTRAAMVAAGMVGFLGWRTPNATRKVRLRSFATGVVSALIVYLDSGTRTWLLLMAYPVAYMEWHRGLARGRATRTVALLSVGAALLYGIALVQLNVRSHGWDTLSAESVGGAMEDNDFFTETAIAMALKRSGDPGTNESVAVLFVSNLVPRTLWSEKPYPKILEAYGWGRRGFDEYVGRGASSLPSVVGQYVIYGGIWCVLLPALFIGGVCGLLDSAVAQAGPGSWWGLVGLAAAGWILATFRAILPGFHYPALLVGVAAWVTAWLGAERGAGVGVASKGASFGARIGR